MKEYTWTILSSGIIAANSYEEAKVLVEENAAELVADDEKYWNVKVDKPLKEKK